LPIAPEPNCASAYQKAVSYWYAQWCPSNDRRDPKCAKELGSATDWLKSPSVIGYEVETTIGPSGNKTIFLPGRPTCRPSD
jgi:hypothetical protein